MAGGCWGGCGAVTKNTQRHAETRGTRIRQHKKDAGQPGGCAAADESVLPPEQPHATGVAWNEVQLGTGVGIEGQSLLPKKEHACKITDEHTGCLHAQHARRVRWAGMQPGPACPQQGMHGRGCIDIKQQKKIPVAEGPYMCVCGAWCSTGACTSILRTQETGRGSICCC